MNPVFIRQIFRGWHCDVENDAVDDVQALVAVGDDVAWRHFHAVGRHQLPLAEEIEPDRSSWQRLKKVVNYKFMVFKKSY